MNYQNLLEKNQVYSDPKVELAVQVKGILINRKVGNVFGSPKRWFQFHDKGRLLVEFSSDPKIDADPKEVINVCEIQELTEEVYQGETFISFTVQEQQFKLRTEERSSQKKWMSALTLLSKTYAGYVPEFSRRLGEKIEPEVEALIRAELEDSYWPEVKLKIDRTGFLKDKGLKLTFDKLKNLKNRLFVIEAKVEARVDKKAVTPTQEPTSPLAKISNIWKKKDSGEGIDGKELVVLLLCQRRVFDIDEAAAENDFEVLKSSQIPSSIDFNTLTFFQYLGPGDETVSRAKVPIE